MRLKVDLHTHSGDDPQDRIPYSSRALIDRAAALGFDVLAITNHNALSHTRDLAAHAAARGILLLPGTELTCEGCHVLVLNPGFPVSPNLSYKLSDLRRLKSPDSLFIAPHPFFTIFQSLRDRLLPLVDVFDAVEFASYYNSLIDFNRPAVRLARERGLPLVATSDSHTFRQFGRTYSLIEAEKTRESIFAAVRAGNVEIRTAPLSLPSMAGIVVEFFSWKKVLRLLKR